MSTSDAAKTSLIDFPAELSVKAMGLNQSDFEFRVTELVKPLVSDDEFVRISRRESSEGKYLSVSVVFVARDHAHLESVYVALRADPRVLFTL